MFQTLYVLPVSHSSQVGIQMVLFFISYSIVFRQALQLYKADPAPVILEIINTIEGGPPVDVSAVRSM
jgi:zinc finger FYVE domain-containing protein 26